MSDPSYLRLDIRPEVKERKWEGDSPHAKETLRLDPLIFESLSLELSNNLDSEALDASQEVCVSVVSVPLTARLLKLERTATQEMSK